MRTGEKPWAGSKLSLRSCSHSSANPRRSPRLRFRSSSATRLPPRRNASTSACWKKLPRARTGFWPGLPPPNRRSRSRRDRFLSILAGSRPLGAVSHDGAGDSGGVRRRGADVRAMIPDGHSKQKGSPMKQFLACVLAVFTGTAAAQSFPSKPIRILVPSPAGSSPDIRARQIGAKLSESLGQPVIVENRPGANGLIAARETARAAPDGHTLFLALINNAIGDALKPDPCCRLNQELMPVSRFTMTPLVMVVNPSLNAQSVKEFVELARARPGALTYASGGTGSISQLVGEWIKSEAGIKVLEVPYKGVNAEIPDLLAGVVMAAYVVPQVIVTHVNAGKLRALAVAGPSRLATFPAVPTTAEAGLPGVEAIVWNGIFAPAGTPPPVIQILHHELVRAYNAPDVKSQVLATGSELAGDTPEEFAAFVRSESAKWSKVIRDANIKPD